MIMKNIFFAGLLSVSMMFVQAQTHHKGTSPHAEFGLKGGLNIADLHIQNTNGPVANPSFYLGGLAHIHIANFFAVQPEIIYSGQGYKQEIDNAKYRYHLNYINVPVLAQFMVGDGFRFESGPQLGVLASAHQKVGGNSTDIKDNFKPVDYSWVFGLGYITHSGFGVDARYNLGLNNINDISATKINNRVFAAGVFYQFNNR
jgi:hypothetical protein